MHRWAILFLIVAIIAGVFGFGGISAAATARRGVRQHSRKYMPCAMGVCRTGHARPPEGCHSFNRLEGGKGSRPIGGWTPLGIFSSEEHAVSPIVLILVVILILSLLGGGYGFRSGNTLLGAGGGVVGLLLVILLILALLGRLPL